LLHPASALHLVSASSFKNISRRLLMKTKTFVCIFIVVILGFLTSYSLLADNLDKLYGTWINAEYDYSIDRTCGKLVFNNDGTFIKYRYITDTEYYFVCAYEIIDNWTDSEGNVWCKATYHGVGSGITYYQLWRVNNTGTTWEIRDDPNKFPTEMDTSWNYKIYYRQE
jgi:hypothetical protein